MTCKRSNNYSLLLSGLDGQADRKIANLLRNHQQTIRVAMQASLKSLGGVA